MAGAMSQSAAALFAADAERGVKVSIMLEESGCPTRVHLVDFNKDDQKTPEFCLAPTRTARDTRDHRSRRPRQQSRYGLFESRAILQYLAEKTGKLLPADAARRYQTIQWLHFQMGGVGPMFGQLGFFHKFKRARVPTNVRCSACRTRNPSACLRDRRNAAR